MNSLYQWQQYYCSNVDYFLRADEDTLLVGSRFEYWLNKEFNAISSRFDQKVIFGHLLRNSPVLRNPNDRWYVSFEWYDKPTYPDYVGGPCYLMTSKAVKLILEEAKNHKHMPIDDAFYTGIVADAAGIKVFDGSQYFGFAFTLSQWDHSCDKNGIPFLFSIVDEDGEYDDAHGGYTKALNIFKQYGSSTCSTFS
uniref:Hexosyltransferase n=1 Tax=Panagrolaimus davidi TaxID=227884 RepID=A0A914PXN1_9BILA